MLSHCAHKGEIISCGFRNHELGICDPRGLKSNGTEIEERIFEVSLRTDGRFSVGSGDDLQSLARVFRALGHTQFKIEGEQIIFDENHVPSTPELLKVQEESGVQRIIFEAKEVPTFTGM